MSTYTSLTYHLVFSTKYRIFWIGESFKEDLYSYIGGIIRGEKGHLIAIGGTEDHLHILASFNPTIALSDMLKRIKGNSSKWINDEKKTSQRFQWQAGYGAFSVSQSQIPIVTNYIKEQEAHHKKLTFEEEFLVLLKRHQINFAQEYLFETEHHD